ncbi:2,3-bisphosphoglycerate-independent phosphoglycerate mutase [Candidatus Nomurabacteria bacterium]|nr:2,3-bisphosphoglycerate-independent phosphoglycerate mutase [Candidatus Nomurabacteria bacterium]
MPAEKIQKNSKKKTLFIIMDGFGLSSKQKGNAITPKTAPNLFSYMKNYPSTKLKAHGTYVGLFSGQQGNSEAGHFNIGAGRVVEQDLVRIWGSITDGTFFKNEAFKQGLFHAKKYNTNIHLMGLLTNHNSAHAHPEHLYALLEYFRREKFHNVYLHLFTDGRDSPPHSAVKHLHALHKSMQKEKIASVMGRFYAMDRNKLWDRTKKAYDTIVLGEAPYEATSVEEAISQAYNRGETDEYISPTIITEKGKPIVKLKNNDVIFFFNARSDRARQLTKAFVQTDFHKRNKGAFHRKKFPKNTRFVAMTDFGPDLPGVFTAFPSPDFKNCLAKAIGEDYRQLFLSETEKYAHVTYFLNGGFPSAINGEKRQLVRSTGHYTYADHPQMMSHQVGKKIQEYFVQDTFDFICVNFPNADMVGHTGNLEAAKVAVHHMDAAIGKLVEYMLSIDGQVVITADHGNAERMINEVTGEQMTEHTTNPVPFIIIKKNARAIRLKKNGKLADVAPTVLKLMGLPKPDDMTGQELY